MKYLLFFGILISIPRAIAQENGADNGNGDNSSYWIGLGFGNSSFGPSLQAGLSFSYNENILTVRYLKADEFRISFGEAYDFDDPSLSLREIGILYGRSIRGKNAVLILSGGVSALDGTYRGRHIINKEYEGKSMATFGIPLEAELRIELTDFFAIGGSFFGNLNAKKSFTGVAAKISIGKFL